MSLSLKREKIMFLAMVLLVFVAGCAEIKTEQPVLPTPSVTSTLVSRWPNTITPKPPYPTWTPRPTRPPTSTFPPLEATVYTILNNCGGYYSDLSRIISPDKQWFVMMCEREGYTKVTRFDSTRDWHIPAIDNSADENGEPFNSTYYKFYKWSTDGRHVYLTRYFCCIDGPELRFVEGFGLYQFNMQTGLFDAEYDYNSYLLSPSEEYIAFAEKKNAFVVYVRNLQSLEQDALSLKGNYTNVGIFSWSPREEFLVFVAGTGDWYEGGEGGFSVFSYDIKTRQLKLLIDNDSRFLFPAGLDRVQNTWLDEDTVILAQNFDDQKYWTLNVRAGDLTPYVLPSP